MARISTYPVDEKVSGSDKWIGSDSQFLNATKNFTPDKVAVYLNGSNKINSQALSYKYQDWQVLDIREESTISFEVPAATTTVPFSSVSTFKLSELTLSKQDVSTFYSAPLVDSYVLITLAENVSDWAVYRWDSVVQDILEPTFYDIGLTLVSSSGGLIKDQDYLISLLQIDGVGGDKNYVFDQAVAASTWVINHTLNKFPSVSIVDSAGTQVNGQVTYNSTSQITITFSSAFSGEAFLN
jgi:hypothetical protein